MRQQQQTKATKKKTAATARSEKPKTLKEKRAYSPYWTGEYGSRAFDTLNASLQRTLHRALGPDGSTPVFAVNDDGLYEHYLSSFKDPVERQHHNCHCCHGFIRRYGGLVTLESNGNIRSAIWNPDDMVGSDIPMAYHQLAHEMKMEVEKRAVLNRKIWNEPRIGIREAGGFTHFWIDAALPKCPATMTPGQYMAELREDRKHLALALKDMKEEHVRRAVAMLEAGGLERPEALLPMGTFLKEVHEAVEGHRGERLNRILWAAVGRAARGWCTPRGSAFGALVTSIAEGHSADAIRRKHNGVMAPLQYQRPQAPPSAGNVARAEKIFEQMGLAESLRRRPMALEEAELIWRPYSKVRDEPFEGVFSHLQTKSNPPSSTPNLTSGRVTMTLAKFQRDVLPKARAIRFLVPYSGNFGAFTTAVVPSAPPLFKWDNLELRNPGAWYLYPGGSPASQWNLSPGVLTDVLGIAKLPPDFYAEGPFNYITEGRRLLILRGAADKSDSGLSIFPECLLGELHEVRATIEAHSKTGTMEPERRDRASGHYIGDRMEVNLEVTTEDGVARYCVDRLE